jgi:thiamine biosynthesis lipoprotein
MKLFSLIAPIRVWVFALSLLAVVTLPIAGHTAGCVSDGQYVMGTILELTLCVDDLVYGRQQFPTLFATARQLDGTLTTYQPDSPVSRLNATAGRGPGIAPAPVLDVLRLSQQYSRLTRGTFDVTVGPFMAAWREAVAQQLPPSLAHLQRTGDAVGTDKLHLHANGTITLRAGMRLDFGGIGKGYAIDQLVTQLKREGVTNALLDFGQSSIWALGTPLNAAGWRLVVQRPDGRFVGTMTLKDRALSISGSMEQTFEIHGRRYGHIIDPRNGTPLQRDLLACVIAPTAAQAEALSKALLILGEQEGLSLLQSLAGVEGILIEATGRQWMTPGWTQHVSFVPL